MNDNLVGFCVDYCAHVLFPSTGGEKVTPPPKLKFIHPGTSFVISHENDPEDLTGLDMPTGPVRWEDGPVDGGGGGREEKATTRAPERGFAGTGLHGVG